MGYLYTSEVFCPVTPGLLPPPFFYETRSTPPLFVALSAADSLDVGSSLGAMLYVYPDHHG